MMKWVVRILQGFLAVGFLMSGYLILLMIGATVSNLKEGLLADATVPFVFLILAVIVFVGRRKNLKLENAENPSNRAITE